MEQVGAWKIIYIRYISSWYKYGLIFLTYSSYLEPQKLVILGLLHCLINHKNYRRSWNLVMIIPEDISIRNLNLLGKSLSPHPETNKSFCMQTWSVPSLSIFLCKIWSSQVTHFPCDFDEYEIQHFG